MEWTVNRPAAALATSLMPMALAVALMGIDASSQTRPGAETDGTVTPQASGSNILDRLPLRFVENRGQWDTPAQYVARRGSMTARLERSALVMELREGEESEAGGLVIRLAFDGAREQVEVEGREPAPGVSNFFLGADPERWRTNVPAFEDVLYRGLYPGIDLRWYEADDWLEYDVLLAPGADLSQFSVTCEGVDRLELAPEGALVMFTELGPLEQSPPRTWSVSPAGERCPLECEFVLLGERRYGFHLPERREDQAVVIDPQLQWSTFLGGSASEWVGFPNGMTIASNDEVLVAGATWSMDFPTWNGVYGTPLGGRDAFVSRLTADGSALVWSTYFGGSADDEATAVVCDVTGKVFVGGLTFSIDLPTAGGPYSSNQGHGDAFLSRFSADGSVLEWSTYLGAEDDEYLYGLLPDGPGAVLATGATNSPSFPTTPGVLQPSLAGAGDAYICRIDTTLAATSQIVWSTYLGGAEDWDVGVHLAFDGTGNVTVGGWTGSGNFPVTPSTAYQPNHGGGYTDNFLVRIDAQGTTRLWGTYLGGAGDERVQGMDVDYSTGQVVICGWTDSSNFPVTSDGYDQTFGGSGVDDAYVSYLDPSLAPSAQLVWSTYLGAAGVDGANSVALGDRGEITVTGPTASAGFPVTPDAFDSTHSGGYDGFLARFDRTLPAAQQLTYCTFLGGANDDAPLVVRESPDGSLVIAGWTLSSDYPTTPGALDQTHNGAQDVFLSCLDLPVRAYCFGTGCPCGNDDDRAGCSNSTGNGASLVPFGSASVAADDLAFLARDVLPGQGALLFVAKNALGGAGNYFGDGMRCAGGGLVRLGVRIPNAAGVATWGSGLGAAGGWLSGDLRRFQAWYRDPVGSPCGNQFNTSHAIEVEFMP